MTYTSQYPPAHNDTYVKATTRYSTSYYAYNATNPAKSLTGAATSNSWLCDNGVYTNQRFHIDLGSAKIIRRIYYENFHVSGTYPDRGCKNFTFWGSNEASAFAELTYSVNTNWSQLTTNVSALDIHVSADQADPKYVLVTNAAAFRYYALKIADGHGSTTYIGLRRVELQVEDGFGFLGSATWF